MHVKRAHPGSAGITPDPPTEIASGRRQGTDKNIPGRFIRGAFDSGGNSSSPDEPHWTEPTIQRRQPPLERVDIDPVSDTPIVMKIVASSLCWRNVQPSFSDIALPAGVRLAGLPFEVAAGA